MGFQRSISFGVLLHLGCHSIRGEYQIAQHVAAEVAGDMPLAVCFAFQPKLLDPIDQHLSTDVQVLCGFCLVPVRLLESSQYQLPFY